MRHNERKPARARRPQTPFAGLLVVLLMGPWPCETAMAEFRGHVGLATDYMFRGISQTDTGPAPQGSAEYLHPAGVYVGIWASRVDYGFDDRRAEINYFLGLQRRLHPELAIDLSAVRYTYDRPSRRGSYNWTEINLAAHVSDHWAVALGIGDNWLGRGARTYSGEVTYRHALTPRLLIDVTLGYNDASAAVDERYAWIDTGLARRFGPLDARLAYSTTSGAGYFRDSANPRVYASLAWQPGSG